MNSQNTQMLVNLLDSQRTRALSIQQIIDRYPSNKFKVLNSFDEITTQGKSLDNFFIFIKGKAAVWNDDQVVGIVRPVEILGLIEYLTGTSYYTADVIAESQCLVLKIKVDDFISLIQTNCQLCYQVLQVFGHAMSASMTSAEQNHLLIRQDILGYYLFLQAVNNQSYRCDLTRSELAKRLNLNLRTLYRYIKKLGDQGMVEVSHGKLVVTKHNFDLLTQRYGKKIW